MKFIHTADWHIGKSVGGFSMLPDQRYFFNQFLSFLDEERPDAVLVSGDVYDRPIPSGEAMKLLDEVLSSIVLDRSIPVLLIAGNHDSKERLSFENDFLAKTGLHVAGNLTDPVRKVTLEDSLGPVHFYLLPYLDPASVSALFPEEPRQKDSQAAWDRCFKSIRNAFDGDKRNVLLCHGFFTCKKSAGAQEASTEIPEEDLGGADLIDLSALKDFDYIAGGHIHKKMPFGPHMRYSGSILKYSKNEAAHRPSVTLVSMGEKGTIALSEKSFPPLHDLLSIEGYFADLTAGGPQPFPTDSYLFVTLKDRELILDVAARLRQVFPNLMGVSYQEPRVLTSGYAVSASDVKTRSIPTLFGEFCELVSGDGLNEGELCETLEAAQFCEKEGVS